MNPAPSIARFCDETILTVRKREAREGHPLVLTCTKGCSECCQEIVEADSSEVDWILESLSDEEKAALKVKVAAWIEAVNSHDLNTREHAPDAHEYRAWRIPCPLLKGNVCSVYARRPLGCRLFMTCGPRIGCEDLTLRRTQKFIELPGLREELARRTTNAHVDADGTLRLTVGHLGFLLAEALGVPTGIPEHETITTREGLVNLRAAL